MSSLSERLFLFWAPMAAIMAASGILVGGCGNANTKVPPTSVMHKDQRVDGFFYYRDAADPGSDAEAEELRTALLNAPDIVSVAGPYVVRRRGVGESGFGLAERYEVRWARVPADAIRASMADATRPPASDAEIYARALQGADLLLSKIGSLPGGGEEVRSYVSYHTRGEHAVRTQAGTEVRGFINPNPWPPVKDDLEWNEPIPRLIAGVVSPSVVLKNEFASGKCALVTRNGKRILAHANVDRKRVSCLEAHFDGQRRLTRVDTFSRPGYPEAEIRKYYSGDLFDLKELRRSIRFSQFAEVNGVAFPAVVECYWFRGDTGHNWDRVKRGEISEVEAAVRDAEENAAGPVVSFARRAEFDLSTLRVNEALTQDDFRLQFPSGSIIEVRTGTQYLIGAPGESEWDLLKKAPNPLDGVSALVLSHMPQLRLVSMHVPEHCPSIIIKYVGDVPPLWRPTPVSGRARLFRYRTNWMSVVSILGAVAGVSALAAVLVLKRRR